jgi:transcriptional regulator with XRE-family HTH domain
VAVDGLKDQAKRLVSVGDFIREQRQQAQVSGRQLAKLAGVSNPYLSQIERGLRKPSAEVLQQIAKGLRISAEQLYLHAGILESRHGNRETTAAILSDATISELHKQTLIQIYESFCREDAARNSRPEHGTAANPPSDRSEPHQSETT